MTNNDNDEGFFGAFDYRNKQKRELSTFTYKVWNNNVKNPIPDPTPGMVLKKVVKGDGVKSVESEIVPSVRAVILFSSPGRKLTRGNDKSFQVVCQSHDGHTPSLRVDEPLCRKVSASDLAKTFAQWKGYDEAKVKAKVGEVTQGTDRLQICGLKTSNGFITLCPYGKKDVDTGQAPACKSNVFVKGYDLERERLFSMELTGVSISMGNFLAPFHEFFKFLRSQGENGAPCYEYAVTLEPFQKGSFYILNVTDFNRLEDDQVRDQMKGLAFQARDFYEKASQRLSKETYQKTRELHNIKSAPVQPSPPAPAPSEDLFFMDQLPDEID